MTSHQDTVDNFINLYYKCFVYDSSRLVKFYSEIAQITRDKVTKQIVDIAPDHFFPSIEEGTEIAITSREITLDNDDSVNFTVEGYSIYQNKTQKLTQKFSLFLQDGSWYITLDDLEFVDIKEPLQPSEELKVLPNTLSKQTQKRNQSPKQKPEQRKNTQKSNKNANKFAPYVPNSN